MKTSTLVTALTALTALIAAACVGVVAAAPATAKSEVDISASAHRVRIGEDVRITATAGSDAAGSSTQVCIEQLAGRHWRNLRCSTPVANLGRTAKTTLSIRPRHRSTVELRSQLFAVRPGPGHRRTAEQTTDVVIVRFVA